MLRSGLLALLLSASAAAQNPLSAGATVDTLLAWESYDAARRARVRVFDTDDPRRPVTVVIDATADGGAAVTEDARFVAETTARRLRFDPTEATFVFRFTAASFVAGARDDGRALLLRATFRRSESGGVGPPAWRVISADALSDLTSRQLR